MIDIRKKTRVVQDFPKPGIGFFDITTVLKDGPAFHQVINDIHSHFSTTVIDKIAGIEARGFVFAAALGYKMNKGVILIRKPGKLPAGVYSEEYSLEYGTDAVEMHKDAIENGEHVLVVDDLLATGGTLSASCTLIQKAGGVVAGIGCMIELDFLRGRKKLPDVDIYSIVHIEGE